MVVDVIPSSAALGTEIVCPITTRVSAEIPLKEASDSVLIPFAAAIPERVSPSMTVWATAASLPAGAAQATTDAHAIAAIVLLRALWPPDPVRIHAPLFVGEITGFGPRGGRPAPATGL